MPGKRKPPLIAVVGPTAVGKTTLSIRLALRFQGEIVSADSRQVYRGMDIGSAKASIEEQAIVPHHLLDVVAPDQPLTLSIYQKLAYQAIAEIVGRGNVPFIVGGSGLYVRAVLGGLTIPAVPPQPQLRAALERIAALRGATFLHRWLQAMDLAAATRIDYRNVRRVIRALEVILASGKPMSPAQRQDPPPYRVLRIGLTRPRPELYRRVDRRIEQMIAAGLIDEVKRLLAAGYDPALPAMSGIGYGEMVAYLRGEISLAEAVQGMKQRSRRFVRQQATWFRANDPAIHWFDLSAGDDESIFALVERFLGDKDSGTRLPRSSRCR